MTLNCWCWQILHQLANRFEAEEDRNWAAGEVGELVAVVDAEVVVDRGEQVLRVERAFGGVFGFGVGGSGDSASSLLLSVFEEAIQNLECDDSSPLFLSSTRGSVTRHSLVRLMKSKQGKRK